MRRGIKYEPISNCGVDRIPDDYACDGYPVFYLEGLTIIAHAMTLPYKHIIVGPSFFVLTGGEQWAVLLHEAGHLAKNHFWKRVLWVPLCWTKAAERMAQLQELEADRYVITKGYGPALLQFFRRVMFLPRSDFHPDVALRCVHAEERMKNAQAIS